MPPSLMKMSAKSAREFTIMYNLYRDCPHSITCSTYSLGRICAHLPKYIELFALQALRRTKSQMMKRRIVKMMSQMMSQMTMMSLMKTMTHLVVILMQAPMMTTHQEMKVLMMILPMLTMIILLEIEVGVIVMMTFLVS